MAREAHSREALSGREALIACTWQMAGRIAQLNKVLGKPLLMSQAFVDVLPGRSQPLGVHAVDGFAEAVPIYRPSRT